MFGNTGEGTDASTAPRLFGSDPVPPPVVQVPIPSPPPAPRPPAPAGGLPSAGGGDYLQRLRGGIPEASPRPAMPKPPAPRASPGPSAFTRALQRVSGKVPAPVASPVSDPDQATGKPGFGIVLGVIGVVGVIAVGLILYFVLTRT